MSYLKLDTPDGPAFIGASAIVAIRQSGHDVQIDAGRWTYSQTFDTNEHAAQAADCFVQQWLDSKPTLWEQE